MPSLAALVRRFLRLHPWQRVAVLAWAGLLIGVGTRVLLRPGQQTVYPIFAQAGRDWRAGVDVYALDRSLAGAGGLQSPASLRELVRPPSRPPVGWGLASFRYSPLAAGLLVPAGRLPDPVGEFVWRLGNAVALVAATVWWLRRAAPSPLSPAQRGVFWLGLAPFALASINNGQTNPLLLALLLAAVTACAERRFTLASLCVGLAFWLKLYPLAVALLLALAYPRRLTWRLALALPLLGAAPFLLQRPDYVAAEYVNFARVLALDDRSDWPAAAAYRDLRLLCRACGLPISGAAYTGVRLAGAGLVAALCVAGRRWPVRRRLGSLLNLGLCWMLLCGPATEGATYMLLGPPLAWTLIDVWRRRSLARAVALASAAAFAAGLLANLFPFAARVHALGPHPLSALLLFGLLVGLDARDLLRPAPRPVVLLEPCRS
jgi:hypothetical protein